MRQREHTLCKTSIYIPYSSRASLPTTGTFHHLRDQDRAWLLHSDTCIDGEEHALGFLENFVLCAVAAGLGNQKVRDRNLPKQE